MNYLFWIKSFWLKCAKNGVRNDLKLVLKMHLELIGFSFNLLEFLRATSQIIVNPFLFCLAVCATRVSCNKIIIQDIKEFADLGLV